MSFQGNPCQHPIVFLKDVTFANLTSILDFMYHGEVNVSHNELATFLKTAEALKVRGLAEDEKKKVSLALSYLHFIVLLELIKGFS